MRFGCMDATNHERVSVLSVVNRIFFFAFSFALFAASRSLFK